MPIRQEAEAITAVVGAVDTPYYQREISETSPGKSAKPDYHPIPQTDGKLIPESLSCMAEYAQCIIRLRKP